MPNDADRYERYYAGKLWQMLPAVYRAFDSEPIDHQGPLRELVNRIGVQAAILRRSIDRLWEDQSIETCDDWVIPYIADLLATNLVASLDGRGQRLDVAKTIYYRRRKGTLPILEEIAADITGWDAKVVEFFRRIGRTRHRLDPPVGRGSGGQFPDDLQRAEGLVGAVTHTAIGGFADLRNPYGASKAHTAFDEFHHVADFRRGAGKVGWHNIPHLGVFVWRLGSFGVDQTTPVPVTGCPGHFTFDPTGREIPLFAAGSRTKKANFGDNWVSPKEFQLRTPISHRLAEAHLRELYGSSFCVYQTGTGYESISSTGVKVYPESGRFKITDVNAKAPFYGTYHYGFASRIGAGPYDRRVLGEPPAALPAPQQNASGGCVLAVPSPTGTTSISDSLTYVQVNNPTAITRLTVRAQNKKRPVLRLTQQWTIEGSPGSALSLEGLFVSGGDVVLTGDFATVTLLCCTLDPGNSDLKPSPQFVNAADGTLLKPTRLVIEGRVRHLQIDRCILGPVRTSGNGTVDEIRIADTVLQALPGTLPNSNAIEESTGVVHLTRSTVLGGISVHRLHASECILNDVASVLNAQDGCVRFSAWSIGSVLPGSYESVEIAPSSPLFTSRIFGRPGYAQLLATADRARVSGANSITAGAQNGSEMGVFSREKNAIKERSLSIKYQEFMPLGLVPVFVEVT